jgi:hypothetical protein
MPYVLPGIPALALLGSSYLKDIEAHIVDKMLKTGLSIVLIGSIAFVLVFPFTGYGNRKSEKSLIQAFQLQKSQGSHLYYLGTHPFSAGFYGNDEVSDVETIDQLQNRLNKHTNAFAAIPNYVSIADADTLKNLRLIKRFRRYSLYSESTN